MRRLIELLATGEEPRPVMGEKCYYTLYGNSGLCVLGKMAKNQCTGLDSVYGELGADGVANTLRMALRDEEVQIIVLECVFATMAWYMRWLDRDFRHEFVLLSVHLDCTLWENYKRIQERRAKKQGREDWYNVTLEDTVYKNVGAKNRETRTIYEKLIGTHKTPPPVLTDYGLKINCMLEEEVIAEQIKEQIMSII